MQLMVAFWVFFRFFKWFKSYFIRTYVHFANYCLHIYLLVFQHFQQLRHVVFAPLSTEKCKICTFHHLKVQILHFHLSLLFTHTNQSIHVTTGFLLPKFKQERQQRRHMTEGTLQTISQFAHFFLYCNRQFLQSLLRIFLR